MFLNFIFFLFEKLIKYQTSNFYKANTLNNTESYSSPGALSHQNKNVSGQFRICENSESKHFCCFRHEKKFNPLDYQYKIQNNLARKGEPS